MRIVFDENMPPAVARAIRELASMLDVGSRDPVQVLHATDLVHQGTGDVTLIQAVADGTHAKSALITTDKSMRTRARRLHCHRLHRHHPAQAVEPSIHDGPRAVLDSVVGDLGADRRRVRPEDDYGLGHLAGAFNVPLRQLEQRLSELPRKREVIACCRGPYRVLSFKAVAALRRTVSESFGLRQVFQSARLQICRSRGDGLMLTRPSQCGGMNR